MGYREYIVLFTNETHMQRGGVLPTLQNIYSVTAQSMECEKNLVFEFSRRRKIRRELKRHRLAILSYVHRHSWDEMIETIRKNAHEDNFMVRGMIKEMFEQ